MNGLELAIDMNADGVDLPPPMKLIWDQFKEIWAKCRHLEKIFEELERIWNMNFFPVSVGKRPPVQRKVLQPQSQASNKENVSGIVDVNLSSVSYVLSKIKFHQVTNFILFVFLFVEGC